MKEIKAYVHRSRIADVIAALKESPAWGGERGGRRHNLAVEVVNEYKLELLCEDSEVDALVDAVVAAARTGQAVAGWVTVSELSRAVPIH